LQGYKGAVEEFRQWSADEFTSLIAFDLAALPAPVTLTDQEVLTTYEIEETIERINSDSGNKAVAEAGSTTIAGFDFTNMGRVTQLVYILIVVSILAAIIGVLFKAAQPEPDFNKQRREKLESRKKK